MNENADLTEQWKKRKIRNGAYYIKILGGDILPAFCNTEYILKQFQTMKGIYSDVAEVLAPVPSFEEWKASYNCMLENEVLRLKNAQLKELLKECQHILKEQNFYRNTPVETDMIYRTRCLKKQELLTKIDEIVK